MGFLFPNPVCKALDMDVYKMHFSNLFLAYSNVALLKERIAFTFFQIRGKILLESLLDLYASENSCPNVNYTPPELSSGLQPV